MGTTYKLDTILAVEQEGVRRTGVSFVVLIALGLLVYFVAGYWSNLSGLWKPTVKITVPIVLLCVTLLSARSNSNDGWYKIALSFLAASTGFAVAWLFANRLLGLWGIALDSVSGIAMAKAVDALLITVSVLGVAWAGGLRPKDLYLSRGRVGWWLAAGLFGFGLFAAVFYIQTRQAGISNAEILSMLPWTLLFVFANGLMEEIHFRGLLLRPFAQKLGANGANWCIAVIFTLVHAPVEYTASILPFLALVFLLSLLWGVVIQKTESIWGAVLIHAGADLLVMAGIYQMFL